MGTVKRSGHGFYGVALPGRGEVMKRGAELALLDGTTLGKEKRKSSSSNTSSTLSDKSKTVGKRSRKPASSTTSASKQTRKRRRNNNSNQSSAQEDWMPGSTSTSATTSSRIPAVPVSQSRSVYVAYKPAHFEGVEDEDDFAAYHHSLQNDNKDDTDDVQQVYLPHVVDYQVVESDDYAAAIESDHDEPWSESEHDSLLLHDDRVIDEVLPWARSSSLKYAVMNCKHNHNNAQAFYQPNNTDVASLLMSLRRSR